MARAILSAHATVHYQDTVHQNTVRHQGIDDVA
jgi:hypothetical protein